MTKRHEEVSLKLHAKDSKFKNSVRKCHRGSAPAIPPKDLRGRNIYTNSVITLLKRVKLFPYSSRGRIV